MFSHLPEREVKFRDTEAGRGDDELGAGTAEEIISPRWSEVT